MKLCCGCCCCCCFDILAVTAITRTSVIPLEVISLLFQVDVSVLTVDKTKLKTFQVIFCVTSYFCFKSCNCQQANFFILNSECRAALGTSGSFEQGSLLHQVSVVPLYSGLFVYSVCF